MLLVVRRGRYSHRQSLRPLRAEPGPLLRHWSCLPLSPEIRRDTFSQGDSSPEGSAALSAVVPAAPAGFPAVWLPPCLGHQLCSHRQHLGCHCTCGAARRSHLRAKKLTFLRGWMVLEARRQHRAALQQARRIQLNP